jgi:hypothetical protein
MLAHKRIMLMDSFEWNTLTCAGAITAIATPILATECALLAVSSFAFSDRPLDILLRLNLAARVVFSLAYIAAQVIFATSIAELTVGYKSMQMISTRRWISVAILTVLTLLAALCVSFLRPEFSFLPLAGVVSALFVVYVNLTIRIRETAGQAEKLRGSFSEIRKGVLRLLVFVARCTCAHHAVTAISSVLLTICLVVGLDQSSKLALGPLSAACALTLRLSVTIGVAVLSLAVVRSFAIREKRTMVTRAFVRDERKSTTHVRSGRYEDGTERDVRVSFAHIPPVVFLLTRPGAEEQASRSYREAIAKTTRMSKTFRGGIDLSLEMSETQPDDDNCLMGHDVESKGEQELDTESIPSLDPISNGLPMPSSISGGMEVTVSTVDNNYDNDNNNNGHGAESTAPSEQRNETVGAVSSRSIPNSGRNNLQSSRSNPQSSRSGTSARGRSQSLSKSSNHEPNQKNREKSVWKFILGDELEDEEAIEAPLPLAQPRRPSNNSEIHHSPQLPTQRQHQQSQSQSQSQSHGLTLPAESPMMKWSPRAVNKYQYTTDGDPSPLILRRGAGGSQVDNAGPNETSLKNKEKSFSIS